MVGYVSGFNDHQFFYFSTFLASSHLYVIRLNKCNLTFSVKQLRSIISTKRFGNTSGTNSVYIINFGCKLISYHLITTQVRAINIQYTLTLSLILFSIVYKILIFYFLLFSICPYPHDYLHQILTSKMDLQVCCLDISNDNFLFLALKLF